MEATLNASIERQAAIRSENRKGVLQLGEDIGRLMVKLTADIEAISAEVDGEERSIQEYARFHRANPCRKIDFGQNPR